MENIVLLDTSVGSLNKGDDIIMSCVREHLLEVTRNNFVLNLPTHLSPFNWYQVARKSNRVKVYSEAKYKFVGGSNLLTMDMLTHFPQWNINLMNYRPLRGSILVGVGAGKGNQVNMYTQLLYKKVLSKDFIHSVRDERTKKIVESMGLRAMNTGCASLWSLTADFCKKIPKYKSNAVVFTLTHHARDEANDQYLIDILNKNYQDVYFWIQDKKDYNYFQSFNNVKNIKIIPPTIESYESVLNTEVDYVGTRLHGGIFAMRHKKRSIIISIDERSEGMAETYNINSVSRNNITELEKIINSKLITDVNIDLNCINTWLNQFRVNEKKVFLEEKSEII